MALHWMRRRLPRVRRVAVVVVAIALTLALGLYLSESSPPREITLATGQPGGMYDTFGHEYQRRLERLGLRVRLVPSNGALDNLRRVIDKGADAAFTQSGTYALADDRHGVVRGLATIYLEPLWIFYRSPAPIDGIAQLAGRSIAIGPPQSGTEAVARALLERHGAVAGSRLVNLSPAEARDRLFDGGVDAAFFVTSYRDAGIQGLLRRPDVRLLGIRHAEAYTRNFPGIGSVTVAEGLFDLRQDVPAQDVTLLAPSAMLVARDDLHPRVVEMLLKVARAVHAPGDLLNPPQRYPSREGMDVPLDETAERYLTTGESFLSRVLPYWSLRWAFLVPLLAVWFPAMRLLPEIYSWKGNRILNGHYGKLRDAEAALLRASGRGELERAIAECEALGREGADLARALPPGRQRDMYQWRQHLAFVLGEARERLQRLPPDAR